MRWLNYLTTGLSLLLATGALFYPSAPASWIVAAIFALIAACAATSKDNVVKKNFIVRLKGFTWTREDFCRGWLITKQFCRRLKPTAQFQNGSRDGNGLLKLFSAFWGLHTLVENAFIVQNRLTRPA